MKHDTQIVTLALIGAKLRLADLDAEREPLLVTIAALEHQAKQPATRSKTTKRVYWTQTPEGRRRMSRLMKASHKRRKAESSKRKKSAPDAD